MQGARRPHARLLRLAGGGAPGSHSSEAADMLVRGSNNPTCNTVEFSAERFSPQANEMSHTVDEIFSEAARLFTAIAYGNNSCLDCSLPQCGAPSRPPTLARRAGL